jgi:hypothetical protein
MVARWPLVGLLLVGNAAHADDRGGALDVILEGGALADPGPSHGVVGVAPIAQLVAVGRWRVGPRIALSAGLTGLPVPEVFALGALGRVELLPVTSDPLVFAIILGVRGLAVQSVGCVVVGLAVGEPCNPPLAEAGGALGELGVSLRTARHGGYRIGATLSALAGFLVPYGSTSVPAGPYLGGSLGIVVTF